MPDLSSIDAWFSTLKTIMPWVSGGLAGAILTLSVKMWSERRRKKILQIETELRRFSLDSETTDDVASKQGLKVSYSGHDYNHLLLYSFKLKNTGYGAIADQKIVFLFSPETNVLKERVQVSPLSIPFTTNIVKTENGEEKHFDFNPISNDAEITITFLVDSASSEAIKIFPRGSDDIEYSIDDRASQNLFESDIKKLFNYLVFYVLLGTFPIIHGALQAGVLLLSLPTIMRIVRHSSVNSKKTIAIENLRVEDGSIVNIGNSR